jgi:hypothetical protein
MPKLSSMQQSATHRVLIYGPPKSGKTQLAGSLSSAFDILWFDLESGKDTLFKLPKAQQERIELVSLPDTRSYPIAIETMLKVIKGGKVNICEKHGKVSCALCMKDSSPITAVELSALPTSTIVVVDSMTQLTNSAIAHITKAQPDDYKLQYDDWGNLGKLMDIFLSHVQQAGYNIIVISHEVEAEQEDGKAKLVPVAGTRNFSRNSAKYFDEVIYCEVKNGKHVYGSSTTYANKIMTGSRTGMTLEKSESPETLLLNLFQNTFSPAPTASETPAQKAVGNLSRLVNKHGGVK